MKAKGDHLLDLRYLSLYIHFALYIHVHLKQKFGCCLGRESSQERMSFVCQVLTKLVTIFQTAKSLCDVVFTL